MRKRIATFCALILLMLTLVACGNSANGPKKLIAGRWESDSVAQIQAMEFSPHKDDVQRGQVYLSMLGNEISGEYEIEQGEEQHQLTITYTLTMFPTTRKFIFTIESEALVLQEENSSVSINYRKVVAD